MTYKWYITYTKDSTQYTKTLKVNPTSARDGSSVAIQKDTDLKNQPITIIVGDYQRGTITAEINYADEEELLFWNNLAAEQAILTIKDHVYRRAEVDGVFPDGVTSLAELEPFHKHQVVLSDVSYTYITRTVPQRYNISLTFEPVVTT